MRRVIRKMFDNSYGTDQGLVHADQYKETRMDSIDLELGPPVVMTVRLSPFSSDGAWTTPHSPATTIVQITSKITGGGGQSPSE